MKYKHYLWVVLMVVLACPMAAEIELQRFSISTYSNPKKIKEPTHFLGKKSLESVGLSVVKVGFRQYSNPMINSSSTLSLSNRLTMTDRLDTMISGDILFYPNPFRLQTGATIQYWLNEPANIQIFIYDMFGHQIFRKSLIKGMAGARYQTNTLFLDASVFNYYNVSAGVYFLYIFDDQHQLIGKSKFAIIP